MGENPPPLESSRHEIQGVGSEQVVTGVRWCRSSVATPLSPGDGGEGQVADEISIPDTG